MGIENLNRFHWILLGAFIGAALAYAWSASIGDPDMSQSRVEARVFELTLSLKDGDRPLISDIVIHPPIYSPADRGDVNVVTYKRLALDRKTSRTGYWLDQQIVARIPYRPAVPGRIPRTQEPPANIQSYLAELAKQPNMESLKFRYGWWLIPSKASMAGAGAGVVLIGGIWPTLLGIMSSAGLAPKRKEKADSLWNYKSKYREAAKSGKREITAADQQELQNVADAYEKNLAPSGLGMTSAGLDKDSAAAGKSPEEIRKLESTTAEQVATQQTAEEIELQNREFYPVVIHHKKGDSDAAKQQPKK